MFSASIQLTQPAPVGLFAVTWSEFALVPLSAIAILAVIVVVVRIIGLRAFSKMSSFDFAVTVSIGSILGSVATSATDLLNGALGVITLLAFQSIVAFVRSRRDPFRQAIDNTPILLMEGPTMLEENLRSTRVTQKDVLAKLRMANVKDLAQVKAVVLETTGDISVLHGEAEIDPLILDGIRR